MADRGPTRKVRFHRCFWVDELICDLASMTDQFNIHVVIFDQPLSGSLWMVVCHVILLEYQWSTTWFPSNGQHWWLPTILVWLPTSSNHCVPPRVSWACLVAEDQEHRHLSSSQAAPCASACAVIFGSLACWTAISFGTKVMLNQMAFWMVSSYVVMLNQIWYHA